MCSYRVDLRSRRHPLADAACHVTLNVRAQCIECGYCDYGNRRKLNDSHFVKPEVRVNKVLEPAMQRFAATDHVKHDL